MTLARGKKMTYISLAGTVFFMVAISSGCADMQNSQPISSGGAGAASVRAPDAGTTDREKDISRITGGAEAQPTSNTGVTPGVQPGR
jgi:hypothetical protein